MRWGAILVVSLMLIGIVLAGTISLTTSITTQVLNTDQEVVQISLTNSGDESAYNVQLSLLSDYFSSETVLVGTLPINKPHKSNITVTAINEPKEGNYPMVLLTEYTDANGYPFSSVSPVTLTYKTAKPSRVTGVFENIEVNGKKTKDLVLKLKNMDQESHDVNVELFLPNELSSDSNEKYIELNSKEEKEVVFKISNFAGLEGSSYVVLASIEYDEEYHHSSIASGMVRIVEKSTFPSGMFGAVGENILGRWIYFAIVGVLIVIFIIYQIKSKKLEFKFVKEGSDEGREGGQ
ncbi:MAG: hypothetical protein GF368_05100 [Candidatus Aenigmarchaeota archaeon]|nr:hypothetical protein [Candidatus Aenigmarchaeota archaeon]